MPGQIVRPARRSATRQIGGTSEDHTTNFTYSYRHQAAVRQRADAERDVDLLLNRLSTRSVSTWMTTTVARTFA
jgi:hypothetical protein